MKIRGLAMKKQIIMNKILFRKILFRKKYDKNRMTNFFLYYKN